MKSNFLPLRLLRAVEQTCRAFDIDGDALANLPDRLPSNARFLALSIHAALPADVRRIDPRAAWELIVSAVQSHVDRVRNEDRNAS
jgi:hypothetical protein